MTDLGRGPAVAVVDVGGTETKSAVVTGRGELVDVTHVSTPRGSDVVDRLLDHAAAHVERVRTDHPEVSAVGLVVPGIVDVARGVAVRSANLGWTDVAFRALLAERVRIPVGFGHDVGAAGRAEVALGAAHGEHDAAVVVLGTGVAAAVVVDGVPVLAGGHAGELGHTVVDAGPDAPPCPCGARGCLEAVAGTAAIARRYGDRSGTPVPGARDVVVRAAAGDPVAVGVWDEALDALAAGLRQLAAITAPRVVVLGGGLSGAGAGLLEPLVRRVADVVPPLRVPELRLTTIGVHAGLVGAALLARDAATGGGA